MKLKITQPKGGLDTIQFKDKYNENCSLQKSSLASCDAIWFGINGDNSRMHLTQKQVESLLPYLTTFVETGELL